ncbi:MAG: DUF4178 domain-containing protein [Neisseria sp.]|nr:DUF4178 domain-containing protein [Neisseria sp.]
MNSEPIFRTTCPSCGAPVGALSATSVTLVCAYCNSMLVREDDGVVDKGRDSALIEDFSPLQVGVQGEYGGNGFTLAGRVQMHYDAGVWNEWYLLFDDGGTGWLSEAGDIYVLTRPDAGLPADLPDFADIRAGFSTLDYQKRRFIASDVREVTMRRAAAQGELPFEFRRDLNSRVADWRCENVFITLDYGSGGTPEVFAGAAVRLDNLKLQNLRGEDEILQSAGRLKGTRKSENCPRCGSPVHWIDGLADNILCPSCGSDLAAEEGKIRLIEADAMRAAQQQALTLPVGSAGTLFNRPYTVIGAVLKEEIDAQDAFDLMYALRPPKGIVPESRWFEYLLYNPEKGFLWLVQAEDGWSVSRTLEDWPRLDRNGHPQGCRHLYSYGGRVGYAVGAFYWHIRHRDLNYYNDYADGRNKLCCELSRQEMAWSRSEPVSYKVVAQGFGLQQGGGYMTDGGVELEPASGGMILVMCLIMLILNLPALAMPGFDAGYSAVVVGGACWLMYKLGHGGSESLAATRAGFFAVSLMIIVVASLLHYGAYGGTAASGSRNHSGITGVGGLGGGYSGGHK